jgi:hypothetical protein
MNSAIKSAILATTLAFMFGCASVDFDMPKTVTAAPTPAETADTYLGKQLVGLAEEHPDQSGFFPLSDGIDASVLSD